MTTQAQPLTITVRPDLKVSGLLMAPPRARACYVLAHGAGAGMTHSFMAEMAEGLCSRGIATLRFQFPSMEQGSRRPDPPALAQATVRAAVAEASLRMPGLPLVAGGRSFGGRMSSQAQSESPLDGVLGLAFLGFPLHPAKKLSVERAKHLAQVRISMLFLQGTRDDLAEVGLMKATAKQLGTRAVLKLIDDADHSFHVRASSGRRDREVREELLQAIDEWLAKLITP